MAEDACAFDDRLAAERIGRTHRALAASTRGRLHHHHRIARQDAFALGATAAWVTVCVADGVGSCRDGGVAATVAVEHASRRVQEAFGWTQTPDRACRVAINHAMRALNEHATTTRVPIDQLGTTLLVVAIAVEDDATLFGAAWTGDGVIAAWRPQEPPVRVAINDDGLRPDVVEPLADVDGFKLRRHSGRALLPGASWRFVIGTDGVANDILPVLDHALSRLDQVHDLGELVSLLDYDKKGSNDDRTLVLVRPLHIDG